MRHFFTTIFYFSIYCATAQMISLSESSRISVYTCGPGTEMYSMFGHTAIRVLDPDQNLDVVYNYGTFDTNTPLFYPKFLRGKLPYQLSVSSTSRFLQEYHYTQRYVKEQSLNLSTDEKNILYSFLSENILPENKEYAYDFYFDNCTTRIRELLRNLIGAEYPEKIAVHKTFRDLLHEYNKVSPWASFGMDIILGAKNDCHTTDNDRMFLPEYFYDYLNTTSKPNAEQIVASDDLIMIFPDVSSDRGFFSPIHVFGMILLLEILMSILLIIKQDRRFQKYWDGIWFTALALAFMVFFFMWFFTNHTICRSNFNMLWTTPWMISIWWTKPTKLEKISRFSFFYCLFIAVIWFFIPQHIPSSCYLILLVSLIKLGRMSGLVYGFSPIKKLATTTAMILLLISGLSAQSKIAGVTLVAPSREFSNNPMTDIARINATWVALTPFAFIRPDSPEIIFETDRQWWGERKEGLLASIKFARESGLKIMLKPHLWSRTTWVGDLDYATEAEWNAWEQSYRDYIFSFIRLAEMTEVDLLCIGTELRISAIKREQFWRQLIRDIRQQYRGKITYCANWDDFEKIPFWDQLDYAGISAYFPLTEVKTPSVSLLTYKWRDIVKRLRNFHKKQGIKVLFTEYGYLAADGAAGKNWELEKRLNVTPLNETAQANAYDALLSVFSKEEWWAGGFLWKWFTDADMLSERQARDYTPQKRKALDIISSHYSKL